MISSDPFYYTEKVSRILFELLNGKIDKERVINYIIYFYKIINTNRINQIKMITSSLKHISKCTGDAKVAFDVYDRISNKLYDYVIKQNIETLEYLKMIILNILNIKKCLFQPNLE